MAFVSDLGIMMLMILVFGVSIPVAAASWMLENIGFVAVGLLIKSLVLVGRGFLAKKQNPAYYFIMLITFLLDIARNGVFLYIGIDIVSGLFTGGLFGMVLGFFDILFGGSIALVIAEGPVYFIYKILEDAPTLKRQQTALGLLFGVCCGLETLSIVALYLIFIM